VITFTVDDVDVFVTAHAPPDAAESQRSINELLSTLSYVPPSEFDS